MRGLPGSGRRDWVTRNIKHPIIEECFQKFMLRLADYGSRPIVIMGRNAHLHEISPFVYLCNAHGTPVTIVTCIIDPAKAIKTGETNFTRLNEEAYALRNSVLPEEWRVEEIVHYEEPDGWFRPVGPDARKKPGTLLESIRRELRTISPSVSRLRTLAGVS